MPVAHRTAYGFKGPGFNFHITGRLEQATGVVVLVGLTPAPADQAALLERHVNAGGKQTIDVVVDDEVVAYMAARRVKLKPIAGSNATTLLWVALGLA